MYWLLVGCVHVVDIAVLGATVAPTTAANQPWDGPEPLPSAVTEEMSKLVDLVDPSGALAARARDVAQTKALPDPVGEVQLVTGAERDGEIQRLPQLEDTTDADWAASPARFTGVRFDSHVRLRLTLLDKDVTSDDPIGSVMIENADLARALRADAPVVVETAEKTSGQLLRVRVQVSTP